MELSNLKKEVKANLEEPENIENPDIFKQYLKRLEKIICHTNLKTAASGKVLEKTVDIVKILMKSIDKARAFPFVHGAMLDFVSVVCDKKAGSPIHNIVGAVGDFYYRYRDNEEEGFIRGNTELFSTMTQKLTKLLTRLEDHTLLRVTFVEAAVVVVAKAMSKAPEDRRLMLDLIKACLRIRQPNTARAARSGLRNCENMYKWKEDVKDAREILDLVAGARIHGSDKEAKEDFAGYYQEFCYTFARGLTRDRIIPQLVDKMVEFCFKLLASRQWQMFECGVRIADEVELNGRKNKDLIMSIFKNLIPYLTDDKYPWRKEDIVHYGPRMVTHLARTAIKALDSRILKPEDCDVICHFLCTTVKADFIDPDTHAPGSVHYSLYCDVSYEFLSLLTDEKKLQRCLLLLREIVNMLTSEYTGIVEMACTQIMKIATIGTKALSPFYAKILDVYVDTDNQSLIWAVTQMYPHNPRPLEPHFQILFEMIGGPHTNTLLGLLVDVAKKQPHLFTDDNISRLIEEMFDGPDNMHYCYMMILESLSQKIPKKIAHHLKKLMEGPINPQHGAMYQLCQVLKNIVVRMKDKALAETVMALLEKQILAPEDPMVTGYCVDEMRNIGGVYRPLLEKRKGVIEDLKKRSNIQKNRDQCTFILDVLEGRSLESLSEEIKEVKEDVEELDTRVIQTEIGLVLVNQEVGQQKRDMNVMKTDVKQQGKKIGKLKESVNETKAKVEELDSKTLSHAPFWSRDVAKLLNPEDILDWRLLSSRLGYSNDDIRGWAQMHDPCIAMLNEWYATRKTSEATFAVFTALQEIHRMDAAIIVENAMKMSQSVVTDEEFEYPKPPEVFISYQWGIQNEVKLLKQHLEKAGFTCWMDIGQMGGGDKLFDKIDKGIRGAKLIICCVTEKYAKSPNCNREVNLSVSLGKPMIPLLMEKMSWPPPGSMGPIFSEYLFIRFFTRPGEGTGDQRYWSGPKFQELLMQLSYNNAQPDEQKVQKEYKNWWRQVAEEIKIEKKNVQTDTSEQKLEIKCAVTSPDVFISYQWGEQRQIQILYKRLTELGLTCWMDIYQMGGGDSLYDKIDKGVRGAKIVLSCVTHKYSLSANCRREVSLADALKKPIVPLLLEKMTWPPSGPMSMVFTQLTYINFAKDESLQERWDGEKFEELMVKMDQHVPNVTVLQGKMRDEVTETASPKRGKQTTKQDNDIPATKPPTSKPTQRKEKPRTEQPPPPPPVMREEDPWKPTPSPKRNMHQQQQHTSALQTQQSSPMWHQHYKQEQQSPPEQHYQPPPPLPPPPHNDPPPPSPQQQQKQLYQPQSIQQPPQTMHQPPTSRDEKTSKSCILL